MLKCFKVMPLIVLSARRDYYCGARPELVRAASGG
jgi:hypothetical protein